MKGEWILVNPTDCFSIIPIYKCSRCKKNSSGYMLESICEYCGSKNKLNSKKYIEEAILTEVQNE